MDFWDDDEDISLIQVWTPAVKCKWCKCCRL